MIRQGEIYWVDLGEPSGSAPGFLRPMVVVQNQLFNESRVATVVVCALTVDKEDLVEKIGSLSRERVHEIVQGIALLLEPEEEAF